MYNMFIDIRITPDFCTGDFSPANHSIGKIEYVLKEYLKPHTYIISAEQQNKFGEGTHFHYHYKCNTLIQKSKDAIQKWLRGNGCKGVKAYACNVHEDPSDEERWWRYALKEQESIKTSATLRWMRNPPGRPFSNDQEDVEALELWRLMAVDERQRQIQMNLASRDREINKNQFRDKMFKKLKTEYENAMRRELFKAIFKHYQAAGKTPPEAQRIYNLVIDFQVWAGELDLDDYYDEKIGERM